MESFQRLNQLWLKAVGGRDEFTLEFRIYHAVLIIVAIALAYYVGFKYHTGSVEGTLLALVFLFIDACLYYISRFNKQMGNNVVLFSIAGNCLFIASYFICSGTDGPSLIFSEVIVLLIVAISPRRQHRFFVLLNLFIVIALVGLQYFYPQLFYNTYQSRSSRYVDICTGYFVAIVLTYFTITYIRDNYTHEKISADEKARAIIAHEEFITTKNIELAGLNERLEYVTKATSDAVWDWDVANNQLFWGKGYENIFGYTVDNNGATSNFDLWKSRVHPDDIDWVLSDLRAAVASYDRRFWEVQYRYMRVDGRYAYVIDRGYLIRNEQRQVIRVVGALQDITSIKAQQIKISHQNEKLKQIANINSHELRKPIATILGLLQLIEPDELVSETSAQVFEYLKVATTELDDVVRKVSDSAYHTDD